MPAIMVSRRSTGRKLQDKKTEQRFGCAAKGGRVQKGEEAQSGSGTENLRSRQLSAHDAGKSDQTRTHHGQSTGLGHRVADVFLGTDAWPSIDRCVEHQPFDGAVRSARGE